MPCRDYQTEVNTADLERGYSEQLRGAQSQIDRLTDLLCQACSVIEVNGMEVDCSTELQEWAANHRKLDAQEIKNRLAHLSGLELRKLVKFLDSL